MKANLTYIAGLMQQLDAAGLPPPESLTFLEEDEWLCLSQFEELLEVLPTLGQVSLRALQLLAEELLALDAPKLYVTGVYRGLDIELGYVAETHLVSMVEGDGDFSPEVDYAIVLGAERHPTMVNSLAHEATHNLDMLHVPDGNGFQEYHVHSTNALFQKCFEHDLASRPNGLAQWINTMLEKRNYTHGALIANGVSADETATVLAEERFAILGELMASHHPIPLPASPLLEAYYSQIVTLDTDIGMAPVSQEEIVEHRKLLTRALAEPVVHGNLVLLEEAKDALSEQAQAAGVRAQKLIAGRQALIDQQIEGNLLGYMQALHAEVAERVGAEVPATRSGQFQKSQIVQLMSR